MSLNAVDSARSLIAEMHRRQWTGSATTTRAPLHGDKGDKAERDERKEGKDKEERARVKSCLIGAIPPTRLCIGRVFEWDVRQHRLQRFVLLLRVVVAVIHWRRSLVRCGEEGQIVGFVRVVRDRVDVLYRRGSVRWCLRHFRCVSTRRRQWIERRHYGAVGGRHYFGWRCGDNQSRFAVINFRRVRYCRLV